MNKNLETIFKQISDRYDAYTNGEFKTVDERIDYINKQYNAINIIQKLIAVTSIGQPIESQVVINNNSKQQHETTMPIKKSVVDGKKSSLLKNQKNNQSLKNRLFGNEKLNQDKEYDKVSETESLTKENNTQINDNFVNVDDTQIKPDEIIKDSNNKDEIEESVALVDDILNGDLTIIDIFKEELENWGINDTLFGYKLIIDIANNVKAGMDYDEVITILANINKKSKGVVSSALGRLVKNADFTKTKYNDYLKSLALNNEVTKEILIKELTDFCV